MNNIYIQTLNKLLDTDLFIGNEWLLSYTALITINKIKEASGYTEKHHIIPRAAFKINNIKVDNTKNNVVTLSYQDHLMAHYLLYKCIKNKMLKYKMAKALLLLLNNTSVKPSDFNTIENITYKDIYSFNADINTIIKERRLENQNIAKKNWANETIKMKYLRQWTKERRLAVGQRIHEYNMANPYHQSKKVICIETGKVFNSIKDAEQYYNIDHHISLCCKNKNRTCGGYHWAYLADITKQNELAIFKDKAKKESSTKKVYCVELNKIFESAAEAAKVTGCNSTHIRECCRGILKSTGKLHWRYSDGK